MELGKYWIMKRGEYWGRYSAEIWSGVSIHAVEIANRDGSTRVLCGLVGGITSKARRWYGGWSVVTCRRCQRSAAYRAWQDEQEGEAGGENDDRR